MTRTRHSHFLSALLGALAATLVLAALPAVAGDGDPMHVGQKNTGKTVTRINTRGGLRIDNFKNGNPALILNTMNGLAPPMQVNSSALVDGLNADLLDGMEAAAFAPDGHLHASTYVNEADHTKAAHDSLGIDADTVDGEHASAFADLAHNHSWSHLTSGVPTGLDDGDDDTLAGLTCGANQVAKRNAANTAWQCADVSGREIVHGNCNEISIGFIGSSVATCPAGKEVTGGGATWYANDTCTSAINAGGITFQRLGPTADDTWQVDGHNASAFTAYLRAEVICEFAD